MKNTSDKHWEAFCRIFDRMDLGTDPRLATNNSRIEERAWLHPELERIFAGLPLDEIIAKCDAAGIPFSPIAEPEDLFEDPQLNEGDSLLLATLPDGRQAKLPKLPIALNGIRFELRNDIPEIGEDTFAILRELDYQNGEISALADQEIIVAIKS